MTNPSLDNNPLIGNWLGFDEPGIVVVRSGKVELGQGIQEVFKRIAAAELHIPVSAVRLISGDTRHSPDENLTAGSFSMQHGGEALRQVCAAARDILLKEAADSLRPNADDLEVRDGVVFMGANATDLSYWSAFPAGAMAQRVLDAVPDDPPVRLPPTEQNGVVARITGEYFIHDLVLPNMLHGRMVRGDHPITGRLLNCDPEVWRKEPGVEQVVCGAAYLGLIGPDEYAVVRASQKALSKIDWDTGARLNPDYAQMFEFPKEDRQELYTQGDWQERAAEQVYDLTVQRPYLSHASIGTVCSVATFKDDRLCVYSHTQGVFNLRRALATALDMSVEQIDVIHMPGSGCYGHNGSDDVALDAALLARAVPGHPVRVVWSRRDELGAAPVGPAQRTHIRATLDENGDFETIGLHVTSSTHNARPDMGGAVNLLADLQEQGWNSNNQSFMDGDVGAGSDRNAEPPYRAAAKRGYCTLKSMVPIRTSSLRALGACVNVAATEMLVDQIARDRGDDPAGFRIARLEDPRAGEVVARVTAMAGEAPNADNIGRGLAYGRYKGLCGHCAIVAEVCVEDSVRLTHLWIAADVGRAVDEDGVINQIEGGALQAASWALMEQVRFEGGAMASVDWETYPILRFSDIPASVMVELIDKPDEPPLGAGEISQPPTIAAIGNAIHDALGVRLTAMPFNRDAIIAAALQDS